MYTYYFEKMEVWKLSKELVKDIYKITKDFPGHEAFGLTGQLRRYERLRNQVEKIANKLIALRKAQLKAT